MGGQGPTRQQALAGWYHARQAQQLPSEPSWSASKPTTPPPLSLSRHFSVRPKRPLVPLGQRLNFLRAARLPSEQCVAGAHPRWTATRQLHHCVDRRATWHLARSRARRRTLATLHPALPALPRWQCRPSLRWLTGSACHAPPAPRCRGRTAACASGADGRTSTAQVRRLHLCTLARCMVRTAAPAGHQRHGHPATQCQLGTSISDRVRITPQAMQGQPWTDGVYKVCVRVTRQETPDSELNATLPWF